jgi:hypothetical protein
LISFTEALVSELHELQQKDSSLCVEFVSGQGHRFDPTIHLSASARADETNALAMVIETATKQPRKVPSEERVTPMMQKLVEGFGDDAKLLGKSCALTATFYEEILKLPKKEGALLLRYLFAQQ